MRVRTFISLMFLLVVFTTALLVFSAPAKQPAQNKGCPACTTNNNDTQMQAADGTLLWESVSRHLLSAVQ
jgi:hypothetical protein